MSQEQTSVISASEIKNKVLRRRNGKLTQLELPMKTFVDSKPEATSSAAPYGYRPNGKPYLRRPSESIKAKTATKSNAKRKVQVMEQPWDGLKKYVSKLVDTQVEIAVNRYITKAFK